MLISPSNSNTISSIIGGIKTSNSYSLLSSLNSTLSKVVVTGIISFASNFFILTVIIPFLICSKEVSLPFENNKGLKVTFNILPDIIDSFEKLKKPFNMKFSDFFFISVISAYES